MLRRLTLVLIVAIGLAAVGILFIKREPFSSQELKTCFDNAGGLRPGAPVRIAGVDVGTVRTVRVNPQSKNCPAEVEMTIATSYEIKIPKDSLAEAGTDGLLGEVDLNIDTSRASGPPIEDYGYLKGKSREPIPPLSDQVRAAELLLKLAQASKEEKEAPKESMPSPPSNH